MQEFRKNIKGRGSQANRYVIEPQEWDDYPDEERPLLRTEFFKDSSRTIVSENKSPDIGFNFSMNPYRGCEHGCAYCYARPTHEYLGHSAGLEFESKIYVKYAAADLLREKLRSKSWKPEPIFLSGVTDCYQPIERKLQITRQCLEVFVEFHHPVSIITKNHLITRDVDLLSQLAKINGTVVYLSVTTLDDDLAATLEPRTSRPQARLKAIQTLAEKGVPVGVNVAPIIPGLTDHEMPAILKAAKVAGARFAGFTPVRLPLAVLPLFTEWLEVHRPDKKTKVLELIKNMRGGKLNDPRFGSRMRGEGPVAENIRQMFKLYARREGLNQEKLKLSTEHFIRPGDQMSLL